MLFEDRHDAGRQLAGELERFRDQDLLVLALPRGGVPVAWEVAQALQAPLDVFVVRKLGVPGHEELAMGAIATGGIRVLNEEVVMAYGIPERVIDEVAREESERLDRYEHDYRSDQPPPRVQGRTVILIDDGLATGSTMRAAIAALRQMEPGRLIVAVPVAAYSTCREIGALVDEVICLKTPEPFFAVGSWYKNFSQTTDEEVRSLLRLATR